MRSFRDASSSGQQLLLPAQLRFRVVEAETMKVTPTLRLKMPFLRHLPEASDILFLEADLKRLVPTDVLAMFSAELGVRDKRRKERQKMMKKEKKLDAIKRYSRFDSLGQLLRCVKFLVICL